MRRFTATVFLTILCISSASVINERPKRAADCGKRIPMTEYFEHGYDLSEYDVFACPEIGGKRAKFGNFNTCSKGQKFKFTDEQKTEYDVPDQIFRADEQPSSHITSGRSYYDLRGLSEDIVKGTVFETFTERIRGTERAFFADSQFYNEMRKIFEKDVTLPLTYYEGAVYGMSVNNRKFNEDITFFTPEFVTDVNALPDKYEGNEKSYIDFVKKYGTHVMSQARFGTVIFRYAEADRRSKESDINWEMRKDAMALNDSLDIICEMKEGQRQVMKVYAKNRKFTQVMVGGRADTKNYSNRTIPLEAVREYPALISSEVQPISTLIDDENKQDNMKKAIKIYMIKAFIKGQVSEIQIYVDAGRKLENDGILKNANDSENIFNEEELNKLSNELKKVYRRLRRKPRSQQNHK